MWNGIQPYYDLALLFWNTICTIFAWCITDATSPIICILWPVPPQQWLCFGHWLLWSCGACVESCTQIITVWGETCIHTASLVSTTPAYATGSIAVEVWKVQEVEIIWFCRDMEQYVDDFHFHYTHASIDTGCEVVMMPLNLPTTGEGM
jgi:hypothetical protein